VTTPVPARWSVRPRRVTHVLIVLVLAFAGWVSCAGTEVWTRIDPVDDASLAGVWAGPDQARLILSSDGGLRANHLPAAAFRGEPVPRLDGVGAQWTRERRGLPPDALQARFADPSATELLFEVRRSWRGRPELILWASRCLSCRQFPVTFARRS
jgi:hypothetical protein